jgi:hypothetical protein
MDTNHPALLGTATKRTHAIACRLIRACLRVEESKVLTWISGRPYNSGPPPREREPPRRPHRDTEPAPYYDQPPPPNMGPRGPPPGSGPTYEQPNPHSWQDRPAPRNLSNGPYAGNERRGPPPAPPQMPVPMPFIPQVPKSPPVAFGSGRMRGFQDDAATDEYAVQPPPQPPQPPVEQQYDDHPRRRSSNAYQPEPSQPLRAHPAPPQPPMNTLRVRCLRHSRESVTHGYPRASTPRSLRRSGDTTPLRRLRTGTWGSRRHRWPIRAARLPIRGRRRSATSRPRFLLRLGHDRYVFVVQE